MFYFIGPLAKVDEWKESEEPPSDAAADFVVDVLEASPVSPSVLPCDSIEYEGCLPEIMNMIRDTSAPCNIFILKHSGERRDALMKVASTLTATAKDKVLACSTGEEIVV